MLLPAFLRLEGRRAVLVGGGTVAVQKVRALLDARAQVVVVAPEVRPELRLSDVEVRERAFEAADLDGAWWVVAAAPPEVNRQVQAAADARRIFVNAVDDPSHATAFAGGIVRRAGVTVAISTAGRAPALAGLLREGIDVLLPHDLDTWMSCADELRRHWKRDAIAMERRRPLLLDALIGLYADRRQAR